MLRIVSKEDPKPGRWLLPIVIAALIGFTYVFVNALPAADIAASTTTTLPPTTTTIAQTTTSSTLPTDILAFLQELDRFENMANDLQTQMDEVNDAREDDGTVGDAEVGFEAVKDSVQDLANQVAATSVPDAFTSGGPTRSMPPRISWHKHRLSSMGSTPPTTELSGVQQLLNTL